MVEGFLGSGILRRSSLLNKGGNLGIQHLFLKKSKRRGLVIDGSGIWRKSMPRVPGVQGGFSKVVQKHLTATVPVKEMNHEMDRHEAERQELRKKIFACGTMLVRSAGLVMTASLFIPESRWC